MSQRVVHVPMSSTRFQCHLDSSARVTGSALTEDGPSRQVLRLHVVVAFEAAAGQNDDAFAPDVEALPGARNVTPNLPKEPCAAGVAWLVIG